MKIFLVNLMSCLFFSQTILAMDLREDIFKYDGVIVRVWRSQHTGGSHVGHVSLETKNSYISLWPGGTLIERGRVESKLEATACSSSRFNTFLEDIKTESLDNGTTARYPEQTIPILFMDGRQIDQHYQVYRKRQSKEKLRWTLAGDRCQMKKEEDGRLLHSCASIVYDLLVFGGVSRHLPLGLNYDPVVPVTPDYVAELAAWAGAYSFLDTRDLSSQPRLWHKSLGNASGKKVPTALHQPKVSTLFDAIRPSGKVRAFWYHLGVLYINRKTPSVSSEMKGAPKLL